MITIMERRMALGMSRKDLIKAVAPEVRPGTIQNLELHRIRFRDVAKDGQEKIAQVLGVKVQDLLPDSVTKPSPCKVTYMDPKLMAIMLEKQYGNKLQPTRKNVKHEIWADTELICKWDRQFITKEDVLDVPVSIAR